MNDNLISVNVDFKGIYLLEETFNRERQLPVNLMTNLNFGINTIIEENDNRVHWLELTTTVKMLGEDEHVYINILTKHVGHFIIDNVIPEIRNSLVRANLPAMMLPYVREHITAITAKAGVQPVILPPINLTSLNKSESDLDT